MKQYEVNGCWYTIKELSELSGVQPHTLRDRLRRGYSVEQAIQPTIINESVREFGAASNYLDWIGMSISDLYKIYWRWVVSSGYHPTTKQGFSRHLMKLYPMLKTVPTRQGECYARVIRLKELKGGNYE